MTSTISGHHRLEAHLGRYGRENELLGVKVLRCNNSEQTEQPLAYIFPIEYVRRMAAAHQASADGSDVADWMSPFHSTPMSTFQNTPMISFHDEPIQSESWISRFLSPVYRLIRHYLPWIGYDYPIVAGVNIPLAPADIDDALVSTVDYDGDPNSLPAFGDTANLGTIVVGRLCEFYRNVNSWFTIGNSDHDRGTHYYYHHTHYYYYQHYGGNMHGYVERVSWPSRYPYQFDDRLESFVSASVYCELPALKTIDEPILLFCNATQLKTVNICFGSPSHDYRFSESERSAITAAFRSTDNLESIRIDTYDGGVVEAVLVGLTNGQGNERSNLRELKLQCLDDYKTLAYWTALSNFTHATMQLTHLQMEKEHFGGGNDMDAFLHCLMDPASVSKLTFLDCTSNSRTSLVQFFETRTDSDAMAVSPLRDFVVYDAIVSGPTLVSMCCMKEDSHGSRYSTIGSRLVSLSVSFHGFECNAFDGLCMALAQNADRIELKCLKLADLDAQECHDLAQFISATWSLQVLELNGVEHAHTILCSLRGNGTVHAVSIPGEIESKLASSYGLRNERTGELVTNLLEAEDRRTKSLFPTLLESTKQVSTRPSSLFSCLLEACESIGPFF
jgi:hypothetical protein